ncbi:MAG: MBL fold metallo-hydrolase [Proteobacteria bacterium]|nr:MBL fold metallo-hydrolase [Pseudomonadota bacterium]MBU1688007.1 MBL fold metallo-hydrolase [Pseudomonadota bacterium]
MKTHLAVALVLFLGVSIQTRYAQADFERDLIQTSAGEVGITFIGHGSLMFTFAGKTIQVDPYGTLTDYSLLPKADVILLTHHHPDHLDPEVIKTIRNEATKIVLTELASAQVPGGTVMKNGDRLSLMGIDIQAVPAYNLVHKRDNGQVFHPRGEGNGYVLTFGESRIYIAGDTENIPEMKNFTGIDYAFLPMNLPYTMTPEMVAAAALLFKPTVLYPYHTGDTDPSRLVPLLKGGPGIELRIRSMK